MDSLLTFTDIVELNLRCGADETVFFTRNGRLGSKGIGDAFVLPHVSWDDDGENRGLLEDFLARAFSAAGPNQTPALRMFDLDGLPFEFWIRTFEVRTTRFKGKTNEREIIEHETSVKLHGSNPWAKSPMDFDELLTGQWFRLREAKRRAALEARSLAQSMASGISHGDGASEAPRL